MRKTSLFIAFFLFFFFVEIIKPSVGETNQEKLKNQQTFPGRRVGGGTRGKCNSRLIAHLVPPSNTYTPNFSRNIALLLGPSNILNSYKSRT